MQISDKIISSFLGQGVTSVSELSHIKKIKGLWQPTFHITCLQAASKPLDGAKLMDKWGKTELGKTKVT